MATKFDFTKGIYRVEVMRLNVRGTPTSENDGNIVKDSLGRSVQFTIGKEFPVYDVTFPANGWAWGIITPEGASQHHYVCLWNLNTVFAKRIGSLNLTDSEQDPPADIVALFEMFRRLESRVAVLEKGKKS